MSDQPSNRKLLPAIGDTTRFRKTLGESDVYLFAGITGDLAGNHVDEETMAAGPYGGRIAHGLLVLGYCGATSTAMGERSGRPCVSYGYDRVRFTAGVAIGDTLEVTYTIAVQDQERQRTTADITIVNQAGRTVMVARHILAFLD